MLWFTPGDYKEGGRCILECLEGSYYCHTIEDYANNYSDNFECRRAMAPIRSVKYLENELELRERTGPICVFGDFYF